MLQNHSSADHHAPASTPQRSDFTRQVCTGDPAVDPVDESQGGVARGVKSGDMRICPIFLTILPQIGGEKNSP